MTQKYYPIFYRVFPVFQEGLSTSLLTKEFNSLNNAIIAGTNSILDNTGYFVVKKYTPERPVTIIGGEQDMGTVVYDSRHTFECNMDKSYKDLETDEWGAAYLWDQTGLSGVEYNFCVDSGINESAIYKMEMNPETNEMETDSNTFEHYEVDFNNQHWEDKLRAAMTTAYNHFFLAEERTQSQTQTL